MNAPTTPAQTRPAGFLYSPMFPLGPSTTPWRKLDIAGVSTATCDRLPRIWPTIAPDQAISRVVTPPRFIASPARMNSGTVTRARTSRRP